MLTVSALLADPNLGLELVVPSADPGPEREVLWLHNTELPDPSPYVRESELVLTNGLWTDQVAPAAFVTALVRARAAGLVFGLTTRQPDVPPAVGRACRDGGLLLLSLPVEVPFTAVTEAAARIQSGQRQAALHDTIRRGNALALSLTRGGGADGVLRVLRRDHSVPLVVVDRSGRQLATAGAELFSDQLTAVGEALCSPAPQSEVDLPGIGPSAIFLVKGAIGGADAGLVCLRPMAQLDGTQRGALDQAALFLSLEVAKQQAVQAIETRFSGELLEMILSGSARSLEIPGRLRAFGIDPHRRLAILTIALLVDGDEVTSGPELVEDFFASRGTRALLAAGSQDIVAVFGWDDDQAALRRLASRLSDDVGRRRGDVRVLVGVGDLADDATGLREPLVRSRETCAVLRRRHTGPTVASFAEVGTHAMLLALHDRETLRRFADDVLGPIREQDRQSGGELERTLRAFLANDGQWSVTARELFIHVNTLRNRLQRVSDISGRDLGRLDERVNLFLAIEADAMS